MSSKRQLPFTFNVASGAGTEIWSALDEDVIAMCNDRAGSPGEVPAASVNNDEINGVVDSINTNIVTPGNTHVTVTNTVKNSIDSSINPTCSAHLQTWLCERDRRHRRQRHGDAGCDTGIG